MASSSCTQGIFDAFGNDTTGRLDVAAIAASICGPLADQSERSDGIANGLNTFLLLFGGAMVFLMHGGFAMLEAGTVSSKNIMNIMLQTILDAAVAAIMFYCVGFGFAFGVGDNPNKFIGDALFGLSRYSTHATSSGTGDWTDWFFQWAFCATAVTIPAGAVAERFNFYAYLGYSAFMSAFVYPVVAHWAWSPSGWLGYGALDPIFDAGYIDFAGSGVIHMVGGLTGLAGAYMVGPRRGRFDASGRPLDMPGHSAVLVVLGTVLLWFGWYGFNPASALSIDTPAAATIVGRAAVTTTLAGSAGGIACLVNGFRRKRTWDLPGFCNGILSGFVAITACCHVVEPWAAIICGALAGLWFDFLCAVLLRLRIDDPLGAGPMHFGCGLFGVLFTGLLAKQEYIMQAYVHTPSASATISAADMYPYGAFYVGSNGLLFASQVVGVLAISGWVLGTMVPFFFAFKWFGKLRISGAEEDAGLDVSKHGGGYGGGYGGDKKALFNAAEAEFREVNNNNGIREVNNNNGIREVNNNNGIREVNNNGIHEVNNNNNIEGGGRGGGRGGDGNKVMAIVM
jgi:Amt family ammonium transporter